MNRDKQEAGSLENREVRQQFKAELSMRQLMALVRHQVAPRKEKPFVSIWHKSMVHMQCQFKSHIEPLNPATSEFASALICICQFLDILFA